MSLLLYQLYVYYTYSYNVFVVLSLFAPLGLGCGYDSGTTAGLFFGVEVGLLPVRGKSGAAAEKPSFIVRYLMATRTTNEVVVVDDAQEKTTTVTDATPESPMPSSYVRVLQLPRQSPPASPGRRRPPDPDQDAGNAALILCCVIA